MTLVDTDIMSIPGIEIVDMDAENNQASRKCSLLYPNSKLQMSGKEGRKERKSSFATFLIVDEKNIGNVVNSLSSMRTKLTDAKPITKNNLELTFSKYNTHT